MALGDVLVHCNGGEMRIGSLALSNIGRANASSFSCRLGGLRIWRGSSDRLSRPFAITDALLPTFFITISRKRFASFRLSARLANDLLQACMHFLSPGVNLPLSERPRARYRPRG
jgi:hypothetical protein